MKFSNFSEFDHNIKKHFTNHNVHATQSGMAYRPEVENHLSIEGATDLADRIRRFWYDRGAFPIIRVEHEALADGRLRTGTSVIRSNMRNGLPPGYVLRLKA